LSVTDVKNQVSVERADRIAASLANEKSSISRHEAANTSSIARHQQANQASKMRHDMLAELVTVNREEEVGEINRLKSYTDEIVKAAMKSIAPGAKNSVERRE